MKKTLVIILCLAVLLMPCAAFADTSQDIPVYINGNRTDLSIEPELVNGMCMVPFVELGRKICGINANLIMDPVTGSCSGVMSYNGSFTSVTAGTNDATSTSFGFLKLDAASYFNREDLMVPLSLFNVLAEHGVYVSFDWADPRIEITTAYAQNCPFF